MKIRNLYVLTLIAAIYLIVLTGTASAQITGPLPPGIKESISQNSISNMAAYGDTLWIGPDLQRNINNQNTWYTPDKADSVVNGRARVYSLAVGQDTIIAGLGYSFTSNNSSTDGGIGYYLSTDGGTNWKFIPQFLEDKSTDSVEYGGKMIPYVPIVVPQQSPPYSLDYKGSTIFSANWASGILRSRDFGKTWDRLLMPPSSYDTLSPAHTFLSTYDPRNDNNYLGFAVLIGSDGTIYAGTADGLNVSPNAMTAPVDSLVWYHTHADGSDNGLLGNWVISIRQQPGTGTVWMTNWPTSNGEQYGLVSTDNKGKTFKHYLVGEKVYDIAFDGQYIYVAGDDGLFISDNNGATWNQIRQIRSPNTFIKSGAKFYSVAQVDNRLWVGTGDGMASTTDHGKTWSITRVNFPLNGGNRFQTNAPNVKTYAYPNPFSPSQHGIVRIKFHINKAGTVHIILRDFAMNRIREITQNVAAGDHEAIWDGRDASGRMVANGVVFYQVKGPGLTANGKILVLN